MKNLKIVLSSLLFVAGIIAFSSFKSDGYKKNAFAIQCFYYVGPQPPVTNPTPPALKSLLDPNNWDDASNPPSTTICDVTEVICAICFDPTDPRSFGYGLDGNDKPNPTVLNIVENEYEANQFASYSQGGEIPTDTDIFVYLKEDPND